MKTILIQIRQFLTRRRHVAGLLATALLFAFSTNSSALWPAGVYRFDAITGTVLDKETRKPIEGVVVVGHWGLEKQLVMGSSYTGPLVVKETVTDKDGKFTLPASIATDVLKRGHFNAEMYPEIAFFKSGFEFTVYRHSGKYPISRVPELFSALNEIEYLMPRLSTDQKTLEDRYMRANGNFSLIQTWAECKGSETLTPTFINALQTEYKLLLTTRPEVANIFRNGINLLQVQSCGERK